MTKKTKQYMDLYNEFELGQKSTRRVAYVVIIVYILMLIAFGAIFLSEYRDEFFHFLFYRENFLIIFFPLVLGGGFYFKSIRILSRQYKCLIVYSTLDRVFEDVEFKPDLGVSPNQLERGGLIAFGDNFKCDDYICGKYKGNFFEQCDVNAGGFYGRLMIFEFNKDFKFNLRISEKGFPLRKSDKSEYTEFKSRDRIGTESIAFNDEFDVYSKYDPETFYLLTVQMTERLIKLKNETDGKLLLSFAGNHLYAAVNSRKNAFEPPVFTKLNIEKESNKVYNDIKLITNFVDELKLDEKIYKTYI